MKEKDPEPDSIQVKWDSRYRNPEGFPLPAAVLTGNRHLLPRRGAALDLACGVGANALLLSEYGLEVSAWDLSPVAIERLREEARLRGLTLDAQVRDIERQPPGPASFDLILVAHFLERDLAPAIAGALRPGGLLLYQTFTREAVSRCGPSNPAYRLATNELLRLFPGLVVRAYREEGRVGDSSCGIRDIAMLVAEQPSVRGR